MASAVPTAEFHQNRILSLLTPEVQQRLVPLLERVSVGAGDMLSRSDVEISSVYFPTSLVSSCIKTMGDGITVEVATVGNEGFVGMPRFLGSTGTRAGEL